MQVRNLFGSALVAAGLLLSGCGGMAPEPTEPTHLSTREDELPNCDGLNYEYEYYNSSYTKLVGGRGCSCGAYFRWGSTSSYYQFQDYGTCF